MTRLSGPRRDERGFTLTEVMLAVIILAVAIIGIVETMGTSIELTTTHRDKVQADAIASTYAERLLAANYAACADGTTTRYQAGATGLNLTIPARYTTSYPVQVWDGTSGDANTPPAFVNRGAIASCPTSDTGLQQITISVSTAATNHLVDQLVVVKSKGNAP
jgi:prepilin-type N-terminal cleavage/methylation domain-containing protein